MANNSKLVSLPFIGEINLSKNKLDIAAPENGGFLKNDGVIYGNTLSPLYRRKESSTKDWYTKDGESYSQTNITLDDSDNHTVLQFENKQFVQSNLDTNIIGKKGQYYIFNENNQIVYKHKDGDEWIVDYEIDWNKPILAIKPLTQYLLIFTSESSLYKIYVYYLSDTTEPSDVKSVQMSNIGKPFFSAYNGNICLWSNQNNPETYLFNINGNGEIVPLTIANTDTDESVTLTDPIPVTSLCVTIPGMAQNKTVTSAGNFFNIKNEILFKHYNSLPFDIPQTRINVYWKPLSGGIGSMLDVVNDPLPSAIDFVISPNIEDYQYSGAIKFKRAYVKTHNKVAEADPGYTTEYDSKVSYTSDFNKTTQKNDQNSAVFFKNPSYGYDYGVHFDAGASSSTGTWEDGTTQNGVWGNSGHFVDSTKYYRLIKAFNPETNNGDSSFSFNWESFNQYLMPFPTYEDTANGYLGYLVILVTVGEDNPTRFLYKWIPRRVSDIAGIYSSGIPGLFINQSGEYESFTYITSGESLNIGKISTPNAILENGTLINTNPPTLKTDSDVYTAQKYCFKTALGSSSNNPATGASSTWKYIRTGLYNVSKYPYSLVNYQSFATPWSYRATLTSNNFGEEVVENDQRVTKYKETNITFDSGADEMYLYAGYNDNYINANNTAVPLNEHWRALYNLNNLSALAYDDTLLTDWDSVADIIDYDTTYIIYKDNYGNVIKIDIENVTGKANHQIVMDRYYVINTTSYWNAYDMLDKKKVHWASAWNGRVMSGHIIDNHLISSLLFTKELDEMEPLAVSIFASAQNPNYQVTKNPISGYAGPTQIIKNILKEDNWNLILPDENTQIDFFFSANETVAVYEISYLGGSFFIDGKQVGTDYLNDILFNPNIFSKFIKSYTLKNMILNEGNKTAYPLNIFNGTLAISYRMVNGIENAENVFVIQTLVYSISNNYLFEVIYDNESISNYQCILPLEGLKYLGCLPTEALFWSQRDRCIYSFAGDALMRKEYQWNEVDTIYHTFYAPDTQELYISTNAGLVRLSNHGMTLIPFGEVTDMWFFEDHFMLKEWEEVEQTLTPFDYKCSFEYDAYANNKKLHIKTLYLGSVENKKSQYDCFYVRLFKNDTYNTTGDFKITATTITDMGMDSDTKTFNITASDWDAKTNSIYLRYQPKYQRAVAMTFDIESSFPIISMTLGYNELNEQASLSHINI